MDWRTGEIDTSKLEDGYKIVVGWIDDIEEYIIVVFWDAEAQAWFNNGSHDAVETDWNYWTPLSPPVKKGIKHDY